MRKLILVAFSLPFLAGCGGEKPGELSAEDSRQLNEAAAMLDNAEEVPVSEDAAATGEENIVIVDPVMNE